jgi:pimeloyl-ACP methyl ester carboxylesterase
MAESIAPLSTGVDICYDTTGDPADEPLLLVMGLGGPLIWWENGLCDLLAAAGFFVIRYDNRDVGRSSRLTGGGGSARWVRAVLRDPRAAPYSLADMADDAVALLDHLGIASAHICGVSMGGMIAQTLAIIHPERARSLLSVMSTTGRRSVGWQHPRLFPLLFGPRRRSRQEYIEAAVALWALIGSPAYPLDPERVRIRAAQTWDRGVDAAGVNRQMLAIMSAPDRTPALRRLDLPTMVIHGTADRLVHFSGGRATARAIPDAELELVPGMGHDIPPQLWPQLVRAVTRTAGRVTPRPSPAPG